MKIFSIIVLTVLALIILVLSIYLLIGGICFKLVLSPRSSVKRKSAKNLRDNLDKYKIDPSWWTEKEFESLRITSRDGFKLSAKFLRKDCNKLAIVVHGYGGSYIETYNYARLFDSRGYSVLAVECRAHGDSEGDMIGMGWLDRLDIVDWINYMLTVNPNYRIALFGLSMGASGVCMALGEKLPLNVVCAISDCAFDNVYRQLSYVFSSRTHMSGKFIMKLFNSYMKRTRGFDLKNADAVRELKKATIPVLFIHGDSDKFVPTEMVYRLADAVPELRRDVYIVKGAEHAESFPTDPKAYERKVDKFLSKYGM